MKVTAFWFLTICKALSIESIRVVIRSSYSSLLVVTSSQVGLQFQASIAMKQETKLLIIYLTSTFSVA